MSNDLLSKAAALLEARNKANADDERFSATSSDGTGHEIWTKSEDCIGRFWRRHDAEYFALTANTSAEIITGYQDLVRRMADVLELAGKALDDCMVSHAPGQDFAETVTISSKRQRIIASQESISKTLNEARAAIIHTSMNL